MSSPLTHEQIMELARIACHLTGDQTSDFGRAVNALLDYVIRNGDTGALEGLRPLPIEVDSDVRPFYGERLCFRFNNPRR